MLAAGSQDASPERRHGLDLTGVGAALFLLSAVILRLDATWWDERLYAFINQVPRSAADALTPLSPAFLPTGLTIVVVIAAIYAVARDRSLYPLLMVALAASLAWVAANLAKSVEMRVRPYEALADAILRQDPASGASFPSSHTAIAFAVAIALFPFLPRPLAVAASPMHR
jgi:membrane-associated phospholipid phosphatase